MAWYLKCKLLEDMRSYIWLVFLILFQAPQAQAGIDRAEGNSNTPPLVHYSDLRIRPNWGVQLIGSPAAFGATATVPSQGTNQAFAFGILFEYQPAFLQSLGVLGIGPTFNVFPISGARTTPSAVSLFSGGGQIRYQARFFKNQPVVPIAAYGFEYLRYQFNAEGTGSFLIQGPSVGLWVLLSLIEPTTSAEMYSTVGIARTYLTLEWKNMSGSDGTATVSGGSYYAGLRFEF